MTTIQTLNLPMILEIFFLHRVLPKQNPRALVNELTRVGHPRTKGLDKADIYTYSNNIISNEGASKVFSHYKKLLAKPFVGVTTDGKKVEGLYKRQDEGAPVEAMTTAAESLLAGLNDNEREKVSYDIDAIEWYGFLSFPRAVARSRVDI